MDKEKLILVKEMNLMDNRKVIISLNVASIVLLPLFFFLFSHLSNILGFIGKNQIFKGNLVAFLVLTLALFFALLPIHELIHGLFFKVFNRSNKVKYGFKNGMLYATSPNSYYHKLAFGIISLAPFCFITLGLTFLCYLRVLNCPLYIALASLHASGCVGDFYWILLLMRAPKNCIVEDTEVGINLYMQK